MTFLNNPFEKPLEHTFDNINFFSFSFFQISFTFGLILFFFFQSAYISRLTSLPTPEKVQFSTDGGHYALLFRNQVLVYNVSTGDVVADLEHERIRLSDFCYVGATYLVTGADDGKIRLWTTETVRKYIFFLKDR